ncbi:hypothetical protein OIE68_46155 [Nocardia vinacea]|uniref:hypothetical protein n=1 Tax=Nocardia vinacea TaxID=96468 RepID=UPI002E148A36|nr:hypothetical protein OIE68_46155 [Nocardia vinacea]
MPAPVPSPPPCVLCRCDDPGERYPFEDQWVCEQCLPRMARCDSCRHRVITLLDTADGPQLCPRCATGWTACVSCRGLSAPHRRTDTEEVVCARCSAAFFDLCGRCSRFSATSRYVSGGTRACTLCAQRYAGCIECGTLVRDGGDCDTCDRPHHVWNYTYKPDPRFHGDGPLYLGMELEIVVPTYDYHRCVRLACDRLDTLGYLKHDSSIRPTGFEIVTHPMSYRHAIDQFPWQLLGELDELGCATDTSVGLHVHASRDGFSSPAHVYRWMKLLYRNESAVSMIARRRSHFAPFDRVARARVKDTAKGNLHALGLDRHQAINPYPRKTLELRVFASSLRVQQVQAALAFTAASIDYTRDLDVAAVRAGAWEWPRFAAWVRNQPDYQPLWAEMEELACAC